MKKEKMKKQFQLWTLASFVVLWMTVGVNELAVPSGVWTAVHVAGLIISIGSLTTLGLYAKESLKMRTSKEG